MTQKVIFRGRGETFRELVSQIHRSICLLARERAVLEQELSLPSNLSQLILPQNVLALCGIYVDDYLTTGPRDIINSFFEHLQTIWKTTDPQYLNPGGLASWA